MNDIARAFRLDLRARARPGRAEPDGQQRALCWGVLQLVRHQRRESRAVQTGAGGGRRRDRGVPGRRATRDRLRDVDISEFT